MKWQLILDHARIHSTVAVSESFDAKDMVFIPSGCTSIVQLAPVSWNAPFKAAMRKQYKQWKKKRPKNPSRQPKTG